MEMRLDTLAALMKEEPSQQDAEDLNVKQDENTADDSEQVVWLPIDQLTPFPRSRYNRYQEYSGEKMSELVDSIQTQGILQPLIVRRYDGAYQIVSGHNRKKAAERLGWKEIPCLVRSMSDDEALCQLNEINVQQRELLPSQKAFAYKIKIEYLRQKNAMRQIGADEKNEALCQLNEINVQQRELLPSQKAFAYKIKIEYLRQKNAMRQIGADEKNAVCQIGADEKNAVRQIGADEKNNQEIRIRVDEQLAQVSEDSARQIQRYIRLTELDEKNAVRQIGADEKNNQEIRIRVDEQLAQVSEDSARQIQRYIRLTELTDDLLDAVDAGLIGLEPAGKLAQLRAESQNVIFSSCFYRDNGELRKNEKVTISQRGITKLIEIDAARVLNAQDAAEVLGKAEKSAPTRIYKVPIQKLGKK